VSQTSVEELRITLMRLSRMIRINRADDHITDTQLGVLFQLEKGDRAPSALAEHERVTPPSINRTLNILEEAGLVKRYPDADDARKVIVRITQAGRKVATDTRRLRGEWFSDRFAALSAAEQRALVDAAEVMRKLVET